MKNIPNTFNYNEVIDKKTLNTFIFETWLNSWDSLDIICPKKINWSDLDKKWYFESEFSIDNRIDAWWENYKENNVIYTQRLNWTKDQINLPSIWWGWMWMDVSSLSLLEAASIRNFSWTWFSVTSHLSSIWMWAFRWDDLFENNWEWFDKYELQITKDFYKLFFLELWLTRKQIVSHFLRCDENLKLDASFQPINKYWKLFLMKDLIALYNDIKSAKEKWLFVPVNHMYKSTWYVASIKVAALAWADAITTWAWIPKDENNNLVRPKDIISDFFKDIWKTNIRISAFWLIVSMTSPYAPWYDYYIDEDPRNAWWHQWATEGMLKFKKRVWKESVLKSLRKREGIDDNTPIYAGWWIWSSHEIKDMFNMWFNWVQLWTNFAVSEEARNCEWEDFKKALISWNHYWKETEIDEIAKNAIKKLEENIKKEIEIFRKKFEDILQIKKIEKKCEKDLLSLNLDWVSFEAVINNIEI